MTLVIQTFFLQDGQSVWLAPSQPSFGVGYFDTKGMSMMYGAKIGFSPPVNADEPVAMQISFRQFRKVLKFIKLFNLVSLPWEKILEFKIP
jgi:hypothetical protein